MIKITTKIRHLKSSLKWHFHICMKSLLLKSDGDNVVQPSKRALFLLSLSLSLSLYLSLSLSHGGI
ncbi:hypothetical protein KFK09_003188 [Dendrobium nobile]|uniref:Transmembrane protein n=1 Tax=Dendrobium nobile TaxID=94219 RepID=A0A8T3C9D8_DENNO|nr:hypothetical protein KFK09_003188 [Dendrobium nobile]